MSAVLQQGSKKAVTAVKIFLSTNEFSPQKYKLVIKGCLPKACFACGHVFM